MRPSHSSEFTHCNTLQHTATRCNMLQHAAKQGSSTEVPYEQKVFTLHRIHTPHHTVTHCNTLQHTATHCNTGLINRGFIRTQGLHISPSNRPTGSSRSEKETLRHTHTHIHTHTHTHTHMTELNFSMHVCIYRHTCTHAHTHTQMS